MGLPGRSRYTGPTVQKVTKEKALFFFQELRQMFKGWNSREFKSSEFRKIEEEISLILEPKRKITKKETDHE